MWHFPSVSANISCVSVHVAQYTCMYHIKWSVWCFPTSCNALISLIKPQHPWCVMKALQINWDYNDGNISVNYQIWSRVLPETLSYKVVTVLSGLYSYTQIFNHCINKSLQKFCIQTATRTKIPIAKVLEVLYKTLNPGRNSARMFLINQK